MYCTVGGEGKKKMLVKWGSRPERDTALLCSVIIPALWQQSRDMRENIWKHFHIIHLVIRSTTSDGTDRRILPSAQISHFLWLLDRHWQWNPLRPELRWWQPREENFTMWRALFFIFLFAQTSADTDSETVGEKIFRKIGELLWIDLEYEIQ